jgi:Gas vesicle synthesis protein GvpO
VARNRSDARKSREDSRSRRRTEDAAKPASGAEDATQQPDEESPADRLKRLTAATLAGAAVGVAVGAAKAVANRSRPDDGDEPEPDAQTDAGDDAPAAKAGDGDAADTGSEDDSDTEPEAAAAADDDDADQDDSADANSEAREEPADERDDAADDESGDEEEPSAPTGRRNGSVVAAVRSAREQFVELTGREPESVAAVDRSDDGWTVTFEIVELQRVPSSTDVLGSYDVVLDGGLELVGYTRGRRYLRSQSDGGAG